MDYIKKFDLELEKDVIYAGEKLTGQVVVENIENIKVQGQYSSHSISSPEQLESEVKQ